MPLTEWAAMARDACQLWTAPCIASSSAGSPAADEASAAVVRRPDSSCSVVAMSDWRTPASVSPVVCTSMRMGFGYPVIRSVCRILGSAREPGGRPKPPSRSVSLRVEQLAQLVRLRHRAAAGEVLADVRRGAPVDGLPALEQRDAVRLPAGEHHVRAEGLAHDPLQRLAPVADDRHLALVGEREVDRLEQVAERARVLR